jgi:hypothetical protein
MRRSASSGSMGPRGSRPSQGATGACGASDYFRAAPFAGEAAALRLITSSCSCSSPCSKLA